GLDPGAPGGGAALALRSVAATPATGRPASRAARAHPGGREPRRALLPLRGLWRGVPDAAVPRGPVQPDGGPLAGAAVVPLQPAPDGDAPGRADRIGDRGADPGPDAANHDHT